MKEINYNDTIYILYESPLEVQGKEIKSLWECNVGDLVRFNNGHYCECLLRKEIVRKKFTMYQLQFPGMSIYSTESTLKKGMAYKYFHNPKEDVLNARDYSFIELVANGVEIYAAGKIAYKKFDDKILFSKIRNLLLMKTVAKRVNMKTLSDAVKNEGINNEMIAGHIKSILDDPKANPTLKKWALEISMKLLDQSLTADQPNSILFQASEELNTKFNTPSSPLHN